jgi:hypothetical protein
MPEKLSTYVVDDVEEELTMLVRSGVPPAVTVKQKP